MVVVDVVAEEEEDKDEDGWSRGLGSSDVLSSFDFELVGNIRVLRNARKAWTKDTNQK